MLISTAKQFLSNDFNRFLVLFLLALGALVYFTSQYDVAKVQNPDLQVDFFYSPTCPHCTAQKPFNQEMMQKYTNVQWVYHDIGIAKESDLYFEVVTNLSIPRTGTPTTVIGDCYFVGWQSRETTGVAIEKCITDRLEKNENASGSQVYDEVTPQDKLGEIEAPFIGTINIREYSLPALAIVLGLIDGFNPCAMWVLVYLIALVASLNDPKKIWLIVGTFVLSSGILYFLFMTAWLNIFLIVGYMRIVTIIVGIIAIGGGALSVKEYIDLKGNVVCKVGDADDKKKTAGLVEKIVSSPLTLATVFAIITLAFVVNAIEFVCSSAIPAVFTQVLALSNLSFWEYYGYILLYDIFFMLDDMIIFGLAAFAITKSGVGEKYAGYCKVIGGALLLLIGLILLFAPQLLR